MANIKLNNTPVGRYHIEKSEVFVKREDLTCSPPGPQFAKVRGLLPVLIKLKEQGYTTFGYAENSISMATWGVSYFCKQLGLKCVAFAPKYMGGLQDNQAKMVEKWKQFEAEVRWYKACRQTIGFYMSRKTLLNEYKNAYMLPLGLSFTETVDEVSKQVELLPKNLCDGSIVVSVGSGIMASGICRGISKRTGSADIYGILAAPKSELNMLNKIRKYSGVAINNNMNLFTRPARLTLVDTGIGYKDILEVETPFPCNVNYDLKAWKWLIDNISHLKKPILFWNIGAPY